MRCKPSEKPQAKLKKRLWSADEDQKLSNYLINHAHTSWDSVPINAGLQRNGKSCRLRWLNYLRPGLRRGPFSSKEQQTILTLHASLGNKWSQISNHLPGRTDNEIKNYWYSHLKKRIATSEQPSSLCPNTFNSSADITNSSSADVDQSVPPTSHVSNLPKILFNEGSTESNETRNDPNSGSNEDMFDTRIINDECFDFDFDFDVGYFNIDDDFMFM